MWGKALRKTIRRRPCRRAHRQGDKRDQGPARAAAEAMVPCTWMCVVMVVVNRTSTTGTSRTWSFDDDHSSGSDLPTGAGMGTTDPAARLLLEWVRVRMARGRAADAGISSRSRVP